MKRSVIVVSALVVLLCIAASAFAREPVTRGLRPERAWTQQEFPELTDPGLMGLVESAAVDTYCIVWYDFETMHWQGWSRLDRTAQVDTFFHVDDFAGLGGGSHGRLIPLEGTKSMWCGARANAADPYLCSWKDAPGYGNGWDQVLVAGPISFTGALTFSYKMLHDCEPDYDFVSVEYDEGGTTWREIASYTGEDTLSAQHFLPLAQRATKLRFHFASDGAWSDEDGLLNTDGACIVDRIRVSDSGGYVDYQDFESVAVGALQAGIWKAQAGEAYGTYSALRNNLVDKDPCNMNYATQIAFFDPNCPCFPNCPYCYTPFCKGGGGIDEPPCQNELVYSPIIDLTKYSTACNHMQNGTIPPGDLPLLGGCAFRFTVYVDLPLPNLVFYTWNIRNIDETGCPGPWVNNQLMYYYWDNEVYSFESKDIGSLVTENKIQIALGVIDMCDVWYLIQGNCAEHTLSPWFDNARVYRWKSAGPQWGYRDLDLFQDNFPEHEFVLESYVRADAANDINTNDNPVIRPGDSIVVNVSAGITGGIVDDPAGGPAVYLHVKCGYIGPEPVKPALFGPSLEGSYGSYKSDDGAAWTIIQGETARTNAGPFEHRYMFDLNDSLFTRGYMIEYYFTARDSGGAETALPKWARSNGPYFEFTCLPTKGSDVLFVDDFHGRGSWNGVVEDYWNSAFWFSLLPDNQPDRYDVNGSSSGVSNGPGSRAKNKHLVDQYKVIVWDCGNLSAVTISDGTTNSDKSNDCQMLLDWIYMSEHDCGLWVCGDEVAFDLDMLSSAPAITHMHTWCGVDFVETSYFDLTGGYSGGGTVIPLVTGDSNAGIFVHGGVPDKFYVYGGCYIINAFDVLEKTANGMYALRYPDYAGLPRYAGIASMQTNPAG